MYKCYVTTKEYGRELLCEGSFSLIYQNLRDCIAAGWKITIVSIEETIELETQAA